MQPPRPDPLPVLELASLPRRHPARGDALLHLFGAQAAIRLGLDPVQVPAGLLQREVTVDRRSPPAPGVASLTVRHIGWGELPQYSEDFLVRVSRIENDHALTERAAYAVMALLIHELEGATVLEVLQIGSGGDYIIRIDATLQVEVSGIRNDPHGNLSRDRLAAKRQQVLSRCDRGFASVTTFCWMGEQAAHSYLHYAETRPAAQRRGKKKRGGGKRRKK